MLLRLLPLAAAAGRRAAPWRLRLGTRWFTKSPWANTAAAAAGGLRTGDYVVADLLRRKPNTETFTVTSDAPLNTCLHALKRCHAVVVVNADKAVTGILTAHDVIKALSTRPTTGVESLTASTICTPGATVV